MSLSNSAPEQPLPDPNQSTPNPGVTITSPDYLGLVRFLLEPFLDNPDSLRVDCERSNGRSRILIRVAFDTADKGKVFGRGGRNIQAIRTVLQASAKAAGQLAHLDVYVPPDASSDGASEERSGGHGSRDDGSNSRRGSSPGRPVPRKRP